jgi:hypothetical protein
MQNNYYLPILALLGALGQATSAHAQAEYARPQVATRFAPPPEPFRMAYLRVGVGSTSDALNSYRCTRLAVEYAPMLTTHLGLASRLVGVGGKPSNWLETQAPNQNYKAAYLEQEALFYPLGNNRRVQFAVGAGGFAGYYRKNSVSWMEAVEGQLTNYQLASYQGVHAGYLGSLNLGVALGQQQHWQLGFKSTIQNGTAGTATLFTNSFTIGRRL